MNIAMVYDPLTSITSGSAISTLRFGELLSKKGHKVIFIAARLSGTPEIDHYKGMKIYRFFSIVVPKTEKRVFFAFPNAKKIKKIFIDEKIDILHVMVPTFSAIVSIKAAKSLGINVVAHSHTQPENILMHWSKKIRSRSLNELFYKYLLWIYSKADITICPSRFSEILLKKHNPRLKTIVISNGVDLSKFRKIDYRARAGREKDASKRDQKEIKRLLFVGRLDNEKCVDTLINAMPILLKKCKNTHLDIVGIGKELIPLKKLAKKLKICDSVSFLGRVSDKDLIKEYNICDIFVLPSLAELEGMVVLEAMACGKPIIIADSENSAAIHFVEGNGLLFRPEDPKDLAEKVIKLMKNKVLFYKMASRSEENIKKYDINKSVSMIEKVYSSI
jgi:glycosyltransferase involved in cell wall biosynthesis